MNNYQTIQRHNSVEELFPTRRELKVMIISPLSVSLFVEELFPTRRELKGEEQGKDVSQAGLLKSCSRRGGN